jgi:hypothetical protein
VEGNSVGVEGNFVGVEGNLDQGEGMIEEVDRHSAGVEDILDQPFL